MSRVDDFLAVVRAHEGPSLAGSHAADGVLRALMTHVIHADGDVADEEFHLALRLSPGRKPHEALAELRELRAEPMDFDALMAAVPDAEDRRKLVQFALHVAAEEGEVQDEETELVARLKASIHRG